VVSPLIDAFTTLGLTVTTKRTTAHPEAGSYIVTAVSANQLDLLAGSTSAFPSDPGTYYRVRRFGQRISATEMAENADASGLYYVDVELYGTGAGDGYNIPAGTSMTCAGHISDGYRVTTDAEATAYSRAEILRAEISPSILLVGSPDDPTQAVQLGQQSVQISYERSQLVDEVQSFADSRYHRVVCEDILVKHLLPHYVSMNWAYSGGATEAEMLRAVTALFDELEAGTQLEVTDVVDALRKRGATSVYTVDTASSTGRRAPEIVVVHHNPDRTVQAQIVTDYVDTVRMQRYMDGVITLKRVSVSGIR
jgi:hypothetical protein